MPATPTPDEAGTGAQARRDARRHAGYGPVLANVHYRHILVAQFISNLGNWVELVALQFWLARLTGRLDDQGLLAAMQSLPVALLGLVGGVAADRLNRRTLLFVTQVLAGVVALGVAGLAIWTPEDPGLTRAWIFALGALHGVVMAFNFPAWQVLTPRLVPREQLGRAVALNGIQFNLARTVGPALGGVVLARLGSPPLFVFNAVSFFAMAAVVLTTPDSPAPARTRDEGRSGGTVVRPLLEAAQTIRRHRGLLAVFVAQLVVNSLAAPLVRLLTLYAIDVYGVAKERASEVSGLLLATQGIGAVIGGLALRLVPPWYPKHHFIPVAFTALGLSIALFSLTSSPGAGYGVMLVCGFFWIWSFNQSWAAMQLLAPDAMRGRVLAMTTAAGFGVSALGAAGAGALGEALKLAVSPALATQIVVAGLGVPLLAAGVVMLMFRVPEVDGLARRSDGRRPSRNVIRAILASEHSPR